MRILGYKNIKKQKFNLMFLCNMKMKNVIFDYQIIERKSLNSVNLVTQGVE